MSKIPYESGRKLAGFTLLELMVAIAVAAILVSVSAPSFRSIIQNNRLVGQSNEIVTAFQVARSEALKRNRSVVICPSSDGATCETSWVDGWIVAEDSAGAGSTTVTLENVIRVWAAPEGQLAIANAPGFIRFLPRGAVDLRAGSTFPLDPNIVLSIPDSGAERAVCVSASGRVTIVNPDDPDAPDVATAEICTT